MKNNLTILITGASGFLGTWLADEAVKKGFKLIGVDLRAPLRPQIWSKFATSSLETVDFGQLLDGVTIHAVCHLAGGASVASSVVDPYGDFASLLPGTARLALYIAKSHPYTRILLFSSAAVYGNPKTLPITEDTPVMPISPYGVHKATAEALLVHYSRVLNLNVSIFRIFSVYGPGLRKQLFWDVSQRAINASSNGLKSIQLFGTGYESRDFIYVYDLCQAVLAILNYTTDNKLEIYNIASGVEISIAETAHCLIRHLNIDIDICFDGNSSLADPLNWRADINRISALGFKQTFSLDQGVKRLADWVKSAI